MTKPTDVEIAGVSLYFLPVQTRMPLKFGPEITTSVTCARASIRVVDHRGASAEGWGETPLSVQWVWPSELAYERRHEALKAFCLSLVEAWLRFEARGHPIELGYDFQEHVLPEVLRQTNVPCKASERIPWLAALVCCSAFDLALHDAYGQLQQRPVYETYGPPFMTRDLSDFLRATPAAEVSFKDRYPQDFLLAKRPETLPAWHLVGGLDPLDEGELSGQEPNDGYPVLLTDWIQRDGLRCLKIKLRGNDSEWDYQRLIKVGKIAVENGVDWLTTDFNCTVIDPAYVNAILDRACHEHPRTYGMILYVEQPFPYDLREHRIDVRSVSARKPLFLDESAHDWRMLSLGRDLGWSGAALKTCKTQTGALLSCCWAKAHGMTLMVQDLTNPMLAQIPHLLLAAHVGTIMGVETNAMQFYPDASAPEEIIHPGLYRRREGKVDLSTVRGAGFGYRLAEIRRRLPPAVANFTR